jgi:hypothetical protein
VIPAPQHDGLAERLGEPAETAAGEVVADTVAVQVSGENDGLRRRFRITQNGSRLLLPLVRRDSRLGLEVH